MSSLYLARQKPEDRYELVNKLHGAQKGHCFICEEAIDLAVHKNAIEIDHVVPLTIGGKDDPSNFALAHASCNRSKQASDLEVARILHRFTRLKKKLEEENRSPNLGDVLKESGGGNHKLNFKIDAKTVTYSLSELGDNSLYTVPLYDDDLSGFRYFFARMPIQYLAHDGHINPRSIGANFSKLVAEFHQKRPQLHVALAWVRSDAGLKCPSRLRRSAQSGSADHAGRARVTCSRVYRSRCRHSDNHEHKRRDHTQASRVRQIRPEALGKFVVSGPGAAFPKGNWPCGRRSALFRA